MGAGMAKWAARAALPLLLVVLASAPWWAGDRPYLLHLLVLVFVLAIPAVGLNLMLGYSGLVSLGHMGFAGVGAYAAAVLMVDAHWNFWAGLLAGSVAAGAVGGLIGLVCFRFRGHFFMIVTLAFGLVLFAVMNNWDAVTRGAAGFAGIPRPGPLQWGDAVVSFGRLQNFYYVALLLAVLAFCLQYLVVRSDLGRILGAIRQDERLARSRGVNTLLYKTVVFTIGTAIAGMGGVLQVSFLRVAAPASFTMLESINMVLIVVVGGAASMAGPALGAFAYVVLPEFLRLAENWRLVIFGALLVLIMLFAPAGLAGLFDSLWQRLVRRRGEGT